MQHSPRKVWIILLLALFIGIFTMSIAQDEDSAEVVGSSLVIEEVLIKLAESSDTEFEFVARATGTGAGAELFCTGEAPLFAATRALSEQEEALCAGNQTQFHEYLLAYDILTLITHPDLEEPECLVAADLKTLFAPSAANQTINWSNTNLTTDEIPLTVFLPSSNTAMYALLDGFVSGFGLREDAEQTDSVPDLVSQTPGAIGVTTFASIQGRNDIKTLELNTTELNQCSMPSEEAVTNRQYDVVNQFFLYVSADFKSEAFSKFLEFAFSNEGLQVSMAGSFTVPGTSSLELNRSILAGDTDTGRQFSLPSTVFEIPPNISGTVTFSGSTNPTAYLASVKRQFNTIYPSVNIELNMLGENPAIDAFCGDGEDAPDFLTTALPLSVEVIDNCEIGSDELLTYSLGTQATILIGNQMDEFTTCLTTDQVRAIWSSPATDTVISWDQVIDGAPDQDLFTIAPIVGASREVSMLLAQATGPSLPMRTDPTESNFDPLYRTAAVSNVSGTISFMSWTDYQEVLESDISGYKVIAVDSGDGCVIPSLETINTFEYPYSEPSTLSLKKASLDRPEVQSILWYVFSDENYRLLENAGFTGISLGELPTIREELQDMFVVADGTASVQDDGAFGFDPLARPDFPAVGPEATSVPSDSD